jgi:hypothetical protein
MAWDWNGPDHDLVVVDGSGIEEAWLVITAGCIQRDELEEKKENERMRKETEERQRHADEARERQEARDYRNGHRSSSSSTSHNSNSRPLTSYNSDSRPLTSYSSNPDSSFSFGVSGSCSKPAKPTTYTYTIPSKSSQSSYSRNPPAYSPSHIQSHHGDRHRNLRGSAEELIESNEEEVNWKEFGDEVKEEFEEELNGKWFEKELNELDELEFRSIRIVIKSVQACP